MRNVSAETHMSFCERKIWFAPAQESNHDIKCESNPLPFQLPLISKIGRLSPINVELNLFQGLESAVHWKKKKKKVQKRRSAHAWK